MPFVRFIKFYHNCFSMYEVIYPRNTFVNEVIIPWDFENSILNNVLKYIYYKLRSIDIY